MYKDKRKKPLSIMKITSKRSLKPEEKHLNDLAEIVITSITIALKTTRTNRKQLVVSVTKTYVF